MKIGTYLATPNRWITQNNNGTKWYGLQNKTVNSKDTSKL